jgi:hypothetical protein
LSDGLSVKEYLDGKQVKVAEYGELLFKYDKIDNDFGTINFNVTYIIPGGKKPKKIDFKAKILVQNDDFRSPSFVRGFSLQNDAVYYTPNYGFPTTFELYENGEIYYQDKQIISMSEYIKAQKSGVLIQSRAPFKICN